MGYVYSPMAGNTISVYYSFVDLQMPDNRFFTYLQQLPPVLHEGILKYHNRADQVRTLTGKLLMKKAITEAGFPPGALNNILYTDFKRPYINEHFDFNITHSGRCVACCAGFNMRLGIDVEERHNITADDIATVFRDEELEFMRQVNASPDTILCFWTRKEAIVKASGQGLYMQPQDIYFVDELTAWTGEQNWYLYELPLDHGYICYCACDFPGREIVLERVEY